MDNPESPPVLLEFLSNSIAGLSQPEEFAHSSAESLFYQARQYPYLRDYLDSRSDLLSQAYQSDRLGFRQELVNVFNQAHQKLRSLSPSLQAELPEYLLSNQELSEAENRLQTVKQIDQEYLTERKGFITSLVQNWTGQLKKDALLESFNDLPARQGPDAQLAAWREKAPQTLNVPAGEIENSLPQAKSIIDSLWETQQKRNTLYREVFQNIREISRPDFFAQIFLNTKTELKQALQQTRVAQILGTQFPAESDPTKLNHFFRAIAKTPLQKTVAPLADFLFARFNQPTREAIVQRIIAASLPLTLTSLINKYGQAIVNSPVYQEILNSQRSLQGQAISSLGRPGKIFADLFSTIFKGPNEIALAYFEFGHNLGLRGRFFLDPLHLFTSAVYAKYPQLFASPKLSKTINSLIPGLGLIKSFRLFLKNSLRLPSFRFPSFTSTPRRNPIVGWLTRRRWYFDLPLLLSAVAVGALVVLFVFPTFLNFVQVYESTRSTALISSLFQLTVGEKVNCADPATGQTDPRCSMAACDPAKQDCRWPTAGLVTQGPFTACGGSHARLNAIDIGAPNGTDVYATTAGAVIAKYDLCVDGTGSWTNWCGGAYGNYIVIRSDQGYLLKFGHLSQQSLAGIKVGDRVQPTTVIGEVDHNGRSSGPHLHFGYEGSGSINSVLPVAVPVCSNNTPGCTQCPVIYTGK